MKRYEIISREETEVRDYTSMGDLPRETIRWTVKDKDTGDIWTGYGTDGIRFNCNGKDNSLILMPIYEDADQYPKAQCFVEVKDYHAIKLLCWGQRPLPRSFDLIGYNQNPCKDNFGVWLHNRVTNAWCLGQSGTLKSWKGLEDALDI